jgi:hypothetical protein
MPKIELYGTTSCLYTQEFRELLDCQGRECIVSGGMV